MTTGKYRLDPFFSLHLEYETPSNWNNWAGNWENQPSVDVVVQDATGRLLVAGDFFSVNGKEAFGLARIHPDGTLDPTFDASGDNWSGGPIRQIAILPSGSLLLAGGVFHPAGTANSNLGNVIRLSESGELEPSFRGPLFLNVRQDKPRSGDLFALDVNADGSLFCGGFFSHVGTVAASGIVQLDSQGGPSFWRPRDADENRHGVTQIALQNEAKVLYSRGGFGLFSADLQFAETVALDLNASLHHVMCFAVQTSGQVVIGLKEPPFLVRVHADGSLDTSFAPILDGPVTFLSLHNDDECLLVGDFRNVSGHPRSGVAHLGPNGSLLTSFGEELAVDPERVASILLSPDRTYLLVGSFDRIENRDVTCVARFV